MRELTDAHALGPIVYPRLLAQENLLLVYSHLADHGFRTPGLLATYSHIHIQIILTIYEYEYLLLTTLG